jgi:hypothetical protein
MDELLPAFRRVNPKLPEAALNEAVYKLRNFESGTVLTKNVLFMDYLQNGVSVNFYDSGEQRAALVRLVDYENLYTNTFTVANQWTITENSEKRPDVIIFLNGLPVVVFELKGAMPALAQAQTLADIAKAAPHGLFTATAPLETLMRYKDGTTSSVIMKAGERISGSAGFQEVALQAVNPAAVVGAGMQVMAMVSGQYYMDKISKQLEGIESGIERLIDFHNDANIGKLRSIENRMKEIV